MKRELLKNDAGEFGVGDERVAAVLSAMKRVEAPKDFDFKVRARIAAGRPEERPAFGIPAAVRYAVPLVLVILIGAYFGFNAVSGNKRSDPPSLASTVPPAALPQTAVPVVQPSVENMSTPTVNLSEEERASIKKVETANKAVVGIPLKRESTGDRPGVFNTVEAGTEGKHLIPRGFDVSSRPVANSKAPESPVEISTGELLNTFGISGAFSSSGWKVESVGNDSLGGRSGVRSGDIIEAINDQPLSEKITLKGGFNGKTLRVRRDGASVQIVLKR